MRGNERSFVQDQTLKIVTLSKKGSLFFRAVMSEGGTIASIQLLWERIFQIATRREIIVSSVVGLCGLGLILGTRRLLATGYERHLIKQYGIMHVSRKLLTIFV